MRQRQVQRLLTLAHALTPEQWPPLEVVPVWSRQPAPHPGGEGLPGVPEISAGNKLELLESVVLNRSDRGLVDRVAHSPREQRPALTGREVCTGPRGDFDRKPWGAREGNDRSRCSTHAGVTDPPAWRWRWWVVVVVVVVVAVAAVAHADAWACVSVCVCV